LTIRFIISYGNNKSLKGDHSIILTISTKTMAIQSIFKSHSLWGCRHVTTK